MPILPFLRWCSPQGIAAVGYLLAAGTVGVVGFEYGFALNSLVTVLSIVLAGMNAVFQVSRRLPE